MHRLTTIGYWLFLVVALTMTAACSDNDKDESEFHDWKTRNDAFFASLRQEALDSIRLAKSLYSDQWQTYSNWRTYLSYTMDESIENRATDSIYVKILKRDARHQDSPFLNDSVRVCYRGVLIPSQSYPDGYVFAHSGQSSVYDEVFDLSTTIPSTRRNSSFVSGFSTALLHMHVGDRWRVYIPYDLGYGSSKQGDMLPAYSTLIFDIELVAFYRNGSKADTWN